MFKPGSPAGYILAPAALIAALAALAWGCGETKCESASYKVGFNFHIVGMEGDQADARARVETMLTRARTILKNINFTIDSVEMYFYNSPDANRLTNLTISENSDWPTPDVAELMTWSANAPNRNIDVFLITSFSDKNIIGAAAAINGPAEKGTIYSGIVLTTFGGLFQMSDIDIQSQGGTLIHEAVHYLGVFHTTEQTGLEFDYLKDTPECPQSTFDVNRDGLVSASECFNQDGRFLMFWQAGRYVQDKISCEQASVMKVHPMARKK
jgi:hypothetical protein